MTPMTPMTPERKEELREWGESLFWDDDALREGIRELLAEVDRLEGEVETMTYKLTPEREAEIRRKYRPDRGIIGGDVHDLLAEIDRLRIEIVNQRTNPQCLHQWSPGRYLECSYTISGQHSCKLLEHHVEQCHCYCGEKFE